MSETVIKVENLYKEYKLGEISHGTLLKDLQSWWAKIRGKEDPNSLISLHHSQDTEKKSFLALNDISFEVKAGDRVGIIGKNGAGKSTLLKILSRITSPTKGSAEIFGRVGSLLQVGTGFHPELTGKENVYLNGAILGMTRHEVTRKLDEIVDFANVEKYLDTPVKRYSSGMTVRLGFAVAAHLDTDILIADEVLAVGDAEFQKKAIGKMREVSEGEGRTILFVSHNMGSIRRLCNSGILLGKGYVEEMGDIEKIVELYLKENNNEGLSFVRDVVFENDMSKPISITRLSVRATEKVENVLFKIKDKLKVEIEYILNEEIDKLSVCFNLIKNGEVAFRSWDTDTDVELFKNRAKGKYKAEFYLPENLNIGSYSISLSAGRSKEGSFVKYDDCLTFEVGHDIMDGIDKSYTRGGFIISDINWNTRKI